MATTTTATERSLGHDDPRVPEAPVGRSTGWWGMLLFIATEAATFAAFLASYFYVRFADGGPWPPPGDKTPGLLWPSVMTVLLVLSCVPMLIASRSASRPRPGALNGSLAAVVGSAAAFLVLQVVDWRIEWQSSTISENAYGSLFYTITGLHAVHVLIGLGMLSLVLASALRGRLGPRRPEPVRIVALYWYFMAVVAVAVYLTVYLSPYL